MPKRRALIAPLLLAGSLAAAQESGVHHPEAPELTRAERLDQLFTALAAPDADDAKVLERRIAEVWSDSGSDSMDYLLSRGREALDSEEYGKAVDHFTALVELAPDFAEGWNARATAHFLDDDYWRSVADIQRTLTLEPRHFGALAGLGAIFERTGNEAGALTAYREALRLNPHLDRAEKAIDRLAPKVDGKDI